MMIWNKIITLYNKYEDSSSDEIIWHRHTIENCFYKATKNKVNIGNTQVVSDNSIVRIPAQDNFVPPNEWNTLSETERNKYITLQAGDLIVLGEITEEIDEYTDGKRSSDLIAKYGLLGSMFIDSCNINDFMPGAHYLIRGK